MHIELVSVNAVQPNTGLAGTALPGDSLTVKNARQAAGVSIIAVWQTNQVAGFGQLSFPSGHDTTRGWRAGTHIGMNPFLLPPGEQIELTPQEVMAVTIAGSNVAADAEQLSMLVRYGDLPGINARLISAAQLRSRTEKMTTIESSITSVAGPSYAGEELINADSDLLMANRDYAVIGATCRTAVHNICLRGPDLGNVRLAVPGVLRPEIGSQYFKLLSNLSGGPCIPVINSGNKAATFVGVSTDENAGTFLTTLHLALLK